MNDRSKITAELVEAYYQSHLEEFQGKQRWRLQDIFLPFPSGSSAENRAGLHDLANKSLAACN